MENPNTEVYTNAIDSLSFVTIYNFDENHPAGSKINDILLLLDYMGNTSKVEINRLTAVDHHFKFAEIPQNDSLQFEITGNITSEGRFTQKTDLVILD